MSKLPERSYPAEMLFTRGLIRLAFLAECSRKGIDNVDSLKDQAKGVADFLAKLFADNLVSDELMQYYQDVLTRYFRESRCSGDLHNQNNSLAGD